MAIDHLETNFEPHPRVLGDHDYDAIVELLGDREAGNLFQLCWLENHGVRPRGRPDLFTFRGIPDGSRGLKAVSLVITGRLALIYARRADQAAAFGRWYNRRGLRFEHVVSPADCVTPFWEAYSEPGHEIGGRPVRARLIRDQTMYVLEREAWEQQRARRGSRPEPTGLRVARPSDLESVYLASARMHQEETLEDPLETKPDEFRRHVRHRIDSGRSYVWYDEQRRVKFKVDISARGRRGAQISGVYTAPELRGRGLATRGMYDLCEILFDKGLPRIVLYFNRENEPARRVYEKVGFSYYTDYQTVFVASADGGHSPDEREHR